MYQRSLALAFAAFMLCKPAEAQNVRVWTNGFGMANSVFVQNLSGQDLTCDVSWVNANQRNNVTWGATGDSLSVTIRAGETWRRDPGYVTEREVARCRPYVDPFRRNQPSSASLPASSPQNPPNTGMPASSFGGSTSGQNSTQDPGRTNNPWAEQQLNLQRQQLQLQQQQIESQNRIQQQSLEEQRRANAAAEAARAQQQRLDAQRLAAETAERQRQQRVQEHQIRMQQTQQLNNALLNLGAAFDQQRERERLERQQWSEQKSMEETRQQQAE